MRVRSFVPQGILLQLRVPVVETRLWYAGETARRVLVPEAAVDEYRFAQLWEDQVGGPGQIPTMQAAAVTERVGSPSHAHFRLGIRLSDPPHVSAALRRRQSVGHVYLASPFDE